MKKVKTIEVTEKMIKRGEVSGFSCPIKKALWAAGIRVRYVNSTGDYDLKTMPYHWYPLPAPVRKFIKRFDEGLPVKPLTFKLKFEHA